MDKQRTDTVIHISEEYIRLRFHRKKRIEISTHACTCTCACMCPPQLDRISRVCECALHVRVCVLLPFRSSIHCVCLSVCTCASVCPDACIYNAEVLSMCNKHLMLGQTGVIYTHTYTHSHKANTVTQAQYSVRATKNTHTHVSDESPAKMSAGRADNWFPFKKRNLYRGETES